MENRNERHSELRLKADAPAKVEILGEHRGLAGEGRILDVSGRGMLVSVPFPIACGSPVRIESEDTLLLGEVCRAEANGSEWRIAVKVRHSLSGMAELVRLNRVLLGEAAESREPQPAGRAG
ncbi:MAG TPA: PilZ domain-containing protein [Bryobacteraceae bacterium]|nr:PilZ domain-containing protein [Bryobacteraceae bacterium]